MTHLPRPRSAAAAFAVMLALGLTGCDLSLPNSIFHAQSDIGHEIDRLTWLLIVLGLIVFVLVEVLLAVAIVKFRHRPGREAARQIHGNTTLEITWTLLPAVILAIIAVPTVRSIWSTQAPAAPGALKVQVIGHQWWWEFRYPQYNVTTANELYLPVGRTADFELITRDVLHSFWAPALGAVKRDLISNHVNHLWYTPDSSFVYNGFCAEFCGTSHANMKFRVFTLPPNEFEQWIAHQQGGPVYPVATAPVRDTGHTAGDTAHHGVAGRGGTRPATAAAPPPPPPPPQAPQPTPVAFAGFPQDKIPAHVVPQTPIPAGLTFSDVSGDAARGAALYKRAQCIACHTITGVSPGIVGPNLTHVGSRTTIAAGLYPADAKHLSLWIKNAPRMKPGVLMPALGKSAEVPGGYDDQQIADIVAYLLQLK
jgi:cytochrome c oxidase subunit 2